jgi:hypothetical protein
MTARRASPATCPSAPRERRRARRAPGLRLSPLHSRLAPPWKALAPGCPQAARAWRALAAREPWLPESPGCRRALAAREPWLPESPGCRRALDAGEPWLLESPGCRRALAAGEPWLCPGCPQAPWLPAGASPSCAWGWGSLAEHSSSHPYAGTSPSCAASASPRRGAVVGAGLAAEGGAVEGEARRRQRRRLLRRRAPTPQLPRRAAGPGRGGGAARLEPGPCPAYTPKLGPCRAYTPKLASVPLTP